ncbi:hypothetical protein TCAL_09270 [Tigriopus californicus]|uniref:Uncharacterized protein n=1 Tax=Tigriopus californicus TaxID=6832 RepID=A0A553N8B2_TIGCA|nr:cuticle protein 18.7-like [Tigriopus californicus]TRY61684.1 hypothetical protein TCAL_09270 [Tigriopus californicus]
MKFLVLFACVAAASAQLVTYPNGAVAPVETPEVQAAKAAHFAAKGAPFYNGAALPYAYGAHALNYAGAYAYGYNGLQAYPNGAIAPVETPEVQAAKAAHFAAKGLPVAPIAPVAAYAPLGYANAYAYGYNGLQAYPNGAIVPVDEPAVQAAKAEHFAAKGLAYAAPVYAQGPAAYYGPALTVHANGAVVPVEPAEVQEARAAHLANF